MEKVGLNITPKEFKQLSKWAEEVYNIAVVVDYCLVVGIKRLERKINVWQKIYGYRTLNIYN